MKKIAVSFVLILFVTGFYGCKKTDDTSPAPNNTSTNTTSYALGWVGNEDLSNVPVSTNFGFSGATNYPTSVDLTAYLPPVGNQGNYGTCISWATGYYTKTAMEGIVKGYTATQLASPTYQISPRDLFLSIPDNQKATNLCDGSTFSGNFDVLQQRGAATLNTVPYTSLGNCSSTGASASWATEAANHKIKSYRTIDPSINSIKEQLVNKTPVVLGAFLSDNFMTWNSANVLSSNTTYTTVGKHAGHGLTIVGYDDKKGANGAFKVINSWGTNWGTGGFIWIDYNFLLNTFAQDAGNGNKVLMVMTENATKPTTQTTPTPTPTAPAGIDLLAWVDADFSTYSTTKYAQSRAVDMNVFNVGKTSATPQTGWKMYYMYYNAKNANDYGILFYHSFTTKGLASNTYQCANGNCSFNVAIPAGSSLSQQVFASDKGIEFSYNMPTTLSGSYYLALLVDPENALNDADPSDNYFYTTNTPIVFKNGYAARLGADGQATPGFSFKNPLTINSQKALRRTFNTAVSAENPNAYTPEEIVDFLRQQQQNGGLARKLTSYAQQNSLASVQAVH